MSCYRFSRLLFDLKMNETVYQSSLKDFERVMAITTLPPKKKTRCAPATRANCANSACTACSVSILSVCSRSSATTFIGSKSSSRVDQAWRGSLRFSPIYVSANLRFLF